MEILKHERRKGKSRAVGSSNGFQDTVLRQVTGVIMPGNFKYVNPQEGK